MKRIHRILSLLLSSLLLTFSLAACTTSMPNTDSGGTDSTEVPTVPNNGETTTASNGAEKEPELELEAYVSKDLFAHYSGRLNAAEKLFLNVSAASVIEKAKTPASAIAAYNGLDNSINAAIAP